MKLKSKHMMFAALLIAGFAIGCAQKNDGAAQAETYRVTSADVSEYNQLAIEVQFRRPNSNSSEAEINSYERSLNRMAELHNRLRNHNGRNGVVVTGNFAAAEQVMAQGRAAITSARASRATTGAAQPNSGRQEYERLADENAQDMRRAEAMGEPRAEWTSARLNQYIATLDRIPARMTRQLEILRRENSADVVARHEVLKARLEANLALATLWRDDAVRRESGR